MKRLFIRSSDKHRLWQWGVLLTLMVLLLSLYDGAGYVMLSWLGWQVQTSVSLLLISGLLGSVLIGYSLKLLRQLWRKFRPAYPERITNFQQLHPFEQLGCLWLLDAKTTHQAALKAIFDRSRYLKPSVSAYLYRENGNYELAWQALSHKGSLQELLNLQKIELLIAEKKYQQAIEALQQLTHQPATAFVQSLNAAWNNYIQSLWAKLALDQPWLILSIHPIPSFSTAQQLGWLTALVQQFNQSEVSQQTQLLALYDAVQQQPDFLIDIQSAQQWLLLLNALPDEFDNILIRRQWLADELIKLEFNPIVLTIWMQSQIKQDTLECSYFTQRLDNLAQRYPGQPSIALAQYHQWLANGQPENAQAILQQWQQHPDFSYLRLQQALVGQPELLADLAVLYDQ